MAEIAFTKHCGRMLLRRRICEEWVMRAIHAPDGEWLGDDGNVHYAKAIGDREGRILHVVVNAGVQPNRVVTLFFDRRLGKGR